MSIDWDPTPEPATAVLVFSPLAWMKLQYLCHLGDSEVGGFGVARDPEHPLYIDDFYTVPQDAGWAHVEFEDVGVADYTEDRVAEGLKPHQFLRIWIHTHPGDSPHPSGTDEQTFSERFGDCDWAVMFILANGGDVYARLKFTSATGPMGSMLINVSVDWAAWKGQAEQLREEAMKLIGGWKEEYDKNVTVQSYSGRRYPVEIRADTSRLVKGEEGFSQFGATGGQRYYFDHDDVDEVDDDEDGSLKAYLRELGIDFEDLFTSREEDLEYYGFSAEDVQAMRAGKRIEGMTDADFAELRREFEYWKDEIEEAAEEAAEVPDDDDDEAPRKRFRNPKGPVRRGRPGRR